MVGSVGQRRCEQAGRATVEVGEEFWSPVERDRSLRYGVENGVGEQAQDRGRAPGTSKARPVRWGNCTDLGSEDS